MSVFGKIVGGAIGFTLGGPLGAIAGATFGHVFDKSNELYDDDRTPRLSNGESSQLTFYVATFSMLTKLVRTDGHIKQEALRTIEHFMVHDLNLDPYGRNMSKNIFYAAMESDQRFEDFARQFYDEFSTQPQFLEMMIDILLRVATADGDLREDEERLIRSAMKIFHFDEQAYKKIRQQVVGVLDRSYTILGCDRNDSIDHIKSRYRNLVNDYHPDKIASKGLPDEFMKFAHDKFREIQAAYEDIKTERKIK